jgi:hypothetical protein
MTMPNLPPNAEGVVAPPPTALQQPGIPSLAPGGGLPSAEPPGLGTGAIAVPPRPDPTQPQPPPVRRPPTITKDSKLEEREESTAIRNPFERTASMIVDAADDYASRMSKALNERAADTKLVDEKTVHEMMHFSKYGIDAPRAFWDTHDRILEEAIRNNDPDPYAVAERGALDEVYPYRAKLALLDNLAPEQRVQRADELMKTSEKQVAKGETVESMPFLTGPAGLPKPEKEAY